MSASLISALHEAARQLGDSYNRLSWLNGEVDAPMPEQHTVVHLAAALRNLGFAVAPELYLKGSNGTSRRRVDLLAHRPGEVYVLEAKTFGGWNLDAVEEDVQRLIDFGKAGPQATPFTDTARDPLAFWKMSSEKWGCVVIQSFRTPRFIGAWEILGTGTTPRTGLEQGERETWASILRDNRKRVGSSTVSALESLLTRL
jgi:Holliday junction resolvase